jgi:hypothetical protein
MFSTLIGNDLFHPINLSEGSAKAIYLGGDFFFAALQPGANITNMSDSAISASTAVAFFVVSGMLMCCGSLMFFFVYRVWTHQRALTRPQPAPARPIQEIVIPSIKAEIYSGDCCYTCMEKEANTILLCPSNHAGLCVDCARKIIQHNMQCPLCRQDVSGMVHLLEPQSP